MNFLESKHELVKAVPFMPGTIKKYSSTIGNLAGTERAFLRSRCNALIMITNSTVIADKRKRNLCLLRVIIPANRLMVNQL